MATDNLVLNGKSIDTLEEVVENFSPDDMLREFRSGILERWLYNHMEDEKLAEIKSLSAKKLTDEEALNGIVAAFGIDIGSASQKLYKIGMRLLESQEGDRDARRAVECLRKAADMGCADAQYQLAECWNEGISESNWFGACKDRSEAISLYKAAAEQGHPDAQLSYGDELENEESIRWWKMAAKNPRAGAECRADARYWLARAYYEGDKYGVRKNVGIALDYMRKAAIDDKKGWAQLWLGDKYRLGGDVQEIPRTAYEWYDKAAKCGNVSGQYWLAWCYDEGFGIREDPENALECYKKVAEREEEIDCEVDWAQYRIGEFYHLGRGVSEDPQKAFEWYEKSAKRGYADAQYWLGWCYETEFGTMENLQKAVEWYKEGAGHKHAESQRALGLCYLNGKGVAPDPREGFAWLSKAAKQGDAQAKYELGCCYLCGIGCQPNATEAFVLLSAAGQEGYPPAQRELGKRYLEGDKVMHLPKDPKRAIDWLKKAASGDCPDAEAARLLGKLYYSGEGVGSVNKKEAQRLYQIAANGGDAKAMYNLAVCYLTGAGGEKNHAAAMFWAEKAIESEDESVVEDAKKLLARLSTFA